MKQITRTRLASALILVSFGFSQVASAQTAGFRGQEEYVRYCSACHGASADGQGPVANVLTPRPPRLTALTPKFGFPLGAKFVAFVMGTTMPRAHGTSDMPVWGENLAETSGEDSSAVLAIWKIAAYLDSLQTRADD